MIEKVLKWHSHVMRTCHRTRSASNDDNKRETNDKESREQTCLQTSYKKCSYMAIPRCLSFFELIITIISSPPVSHVILETAVSPGHYILFISRSEWSACLWFCLTCPFSWDQWWWWTQVVRNFYPKDSWSASLFMTFTSYSTHLAILPQSMRYFFFDGTCLVLFDCNFSSSHVSHVQYTLLVTFLLKKWCFSCKQVW